MPDDPVHPHPAPLWRPSVRIATATAAPAPLLPTSNPNTRPVCSLPRPRYSGVPSPSASSSAPVFASASNTVERTDAAMPTPPSNVSASDAIQRASDKADAVRDTFRATSGIEKKTRRKKKSTAKPEAEEANGNEENASEAAANARSVKAEDEEESNAEKYERRLRMNRRSAAASRVKREAFTKALESELLLMEGDMQTLTEALEKQQQDNRKLNDTLAAQLAAQAPPAMHTETERNAVEQLENRHARYVSNIMEWDGTFEPRRGDALEQNIHQHILNLESQDPIPEENLEAAKDALTAAQLGLSQSTVSAVGSTSCAVDVMSYFIDPHNNT